MHKVKLIAMLVVVLGALPTVRAAEEPGFVVRLYDVGADIRWTPLIKPGELPNVAKVITGPLDLRTNRGDFKPLEYQFVTEVTGTFETLTGQTAFRLTSDDGALLWIDGRLVINHDGHHGATPMDGQTSLKAGPHELKILHFNNWGDGQLTLEWRPPHAATWEPLTGKVVYHDSGASRTTSPGKKQVVHALRRGRPGDGAPLTREHPAYGSVYDPGALDLPRETWLLDGRLCTMESGQRLRDIPVAWLPPPCAEPGYILAFNLENEPYANQLRVYCKDCESKRVFLETVAGRQQGCVFRFGVTAAVVQPSGHGAFELRRVRAMSNGLELEFTQPLDPHVGWETDAYYIEQWPFDVSAGQVPMRDGVHYPVKSASVSKCAKKVFLEMDNLKPGHVVYLRLLPPCLSAEGELPWSTEAWYTLHKLPTDQPGTVLKPPATEPQNILSPEEQVQGWQLLFDGKTTAGWRGYRQESFPASGWEVHNGCLVRVGPAGDICTIDQFGDFELKFDWRISPAGNSGVFYRVQEDVGSPWETGPEFQVLDNAEHPDGKDTKTSAGSNYGLNAPIRDITQPVGFFNHARIVARDQHVEHWLNGVKVVEYELGSDDWQQRVNNSKFKAWPEYGRKPSGHIVLQDHGDQVWYRNIKIRRLDQAGID